MLGKKSKKDNSFFWICFAIISNCIWLLVALKVTDTLVFLVNK